MVTRKNSHGIEHANKRYPGASRESSQRKSSVGLQRMGCYLTGENGRDVCEAERPGRARLKCQVEEAWRASGGGLRVRWESCSA